MAGRDDDGCGGCESSHNADLGNSLSWCNIHTDSTDRITDNAGHLSNTDSHITTNRVSGPGCGDDTIRDHGRW
jgi:hypothetical protein